MAELRSDKITPLRRGVTQGSTLLPTRAHSRTIGTNSFVRPSSSDEPPISEDEIPEQSLTSDCSTLESSPTSEISSVSESPLKNEISPAPEAYESDLENGGESTDPEIDSNHVREDPVKTVVTRTAPRHSVSRTVRNTVRVEEEVKPSKKLTLILHRPRQHQMNYLQSNQDFHFFIKFPYADVLSTLIKFLYGSHGKSSSDENYFELTQNTFEYRGKDCSRSVLNYTKIDTSNTSGYSMGPLERTKLFLSLQSINELTSNYRKEMSVTLSKREGDNYIYFTPDNSGGNNSQNTTRLQYVEQLNIYPEDILIPEDNYNFESPNAVITANELKDMCRAIKSQTNVLISGTEGVISIVVRKNGISGLGWQFRSNDSRMTKRDEIVRGYVNGAIIKNLSHLEKLAPSGIIKVYIQNPTRIKLVAPIGYLGTQYTYITLTPN